MLKVEDVYKRQEYGQVLEREKEAKAKEGRTNEEKIRDFLDSHDVWTEYVATKNVIDMARATGCLLYTSSYFRVRISPIAVKRTSVDEFSAVSQESWITPTMNPTPTTCIATSFGIPKRLQASGIRRSDPPATPEAPAALAAERTHLSLIHI